MAFPISIVLAGAAVCCAVTGFALRRWYRQAVATAVRAGVRQAVLDANRDPLTGLPTRAALEDALNRADTSGTVFTVALVDVDGLHDINSRWGHAGGDQYLAAVAARLVTAVPAGGRLIRQGGDELTIVAPGGDATGLRDRITAALAGHTFVAGTPVPLGASAGVAVGGSGDTARHVLACADAAMYSAKSAGGGQVLLYRAGRDGRPALDGTRPQVRRRDSRPDVAAVTGRGATGAHHAVHLDNADQLLLYRLVHDAVTAPRGHCSLSITDLDRDRLRSIADRLAPAVNGCCC